MKFDVVRCFVQQGLGLKLDHRGRVLVFPRPYLSFRAVLRSYFLDSDVRLCIRVPALGISTEPQRPFDDKQLTLRIINDHRTFPPGIVKVVVEVDALG